MLIPASRYKKSLQAGGTHSKQQSTSHTSNICFRFDSRYISQHSFGCLGKKERLAVWLAFLISYRQCIYSLPIIFQTKALKAAPTNGPTMNTHSSLNALPPSKIAGAMLRAGFTDVPV